MLFNMIPGNAVQIVSGSVTTSSQGLATINCGFRPDLVIFYISAFTSDGYSYENVIALSINESKQNSGVNLNSMTWADSAWNIIECWPESITDTGITCTFYAYDPSWNGGYVSRQTYSWTAIKYTA